MSTSTSKHSNKARQWWASLTQAERDELIMQAWPLPKPEYSTTIQEAFRDWIEHRAYVDGGRNYRVRTEAATPTHRPSGKIASWNKEVKRLFPSCAEFHEAATKWVAGPLRSPARNDNSPTQRSARSRLA